MCFQFPHIWSYLPHLLLQVVNTWPCFLLKRHDILLQGHSVISQSFHHLIKIITGWQPHNIGFCEWRGLSRLIILLGLKSIGMELSVLIALLRLVPIMQVGMISLSRIVSVGKRIILTLRLSIECFINCISLFNVIFLHCWAHIEACPCKENMLQTFTWCTLTLFSRLEILTSFTCLLVNSPRMPNYFKLVAIFEINWHAASGVLFTNAPPLAASMILQSIGINPS